MLDINLNVKNLHYNSVSKEYVNVVEPNFLTNIAAQKPLLPFQKKLGSNMFDHKSPYSSVYSFFV